MMLLHVSILAVLLLTLSADSEDSDCSLEISTPRNRVHNVSVGGNLTINCQVNFCKGLKPNVSWHKVENGTDHVISSRVQAGWERSDNSEGIFSLMFREMQSSDSGQYRCQSGHAVGHNIKVTVSDDRHGTETNETLTFNPPPPEDLWMYVYAVAGTTAFVILVIITSVVAMQRCKGASKNGIRTGKQPAEIPMAESHPPHDAGPQTPARGSRPAPPPCQSAGNKAPPSQPRDDGKVYSKIKKQKQQKRNMAEVEEGSLVYAALNHQQQPRPHAPPPRPAEESSEYAAIRVS